jgi:hypothetical protein
MSEKPGQAEKVGHPPNPTGSQAKFPGLEHRETRATRRHRSRCKGKDAELSIGK